VCTTNGLQQFDHPLVAVKLHVQCRVAVELYLAAIGQCHLAPFAHAGALVGHPHRQALNPGPAAQQHTQQRDGLGATGGKPCFLWGKCTVQGHARRGGGQLVEAAPQAAHALDGDGMPWIGLAPFLEGRAVGLGHVVVVQQRQPAGGFTDDLLGTHDSGSAPCRV
jgi:hypothetical protein